VSSLVATYRLAYSDDEVELCSACVARGDHDCGPLGPCTVGTRQGACEGKRHGRKPSRPTFNRDGVTNVDVRALAKEAAAAGDPQMVALCELALDGDSNAAEKCINAIEQAWNRALGES
jgi:hypothetical protein